MAEKIGQKPKIYSQEELRKMYGLPKRSWANYFGHSEPELSQPKTHKHNING